MRHQCRRLFKIDTNSREPLKQAMKSLNRIFNPGTCVACAKSKLYCREREGKVRNLLPKITYSVLHMRRKIVVGKCERIHCFSE
jgi:hypothetical protein